MWVTGGDTQVFPETGAHPDTRAFPEAGILRGGRAALPEADETAVLPRSRPADFRRAPDARQVSAPYGEQTAVLPATAAGGLTPPATMAFPGSIGALGDPWDQPAPASPSVTASVDAVTGDPTHDPHEVTIQLDAVQLGDVQLSPAAGAPRGTGRDDGPVFVDESGRRSRTFRRLGMLVGLACAVYAVVIVATLLSGSSDAPWLPVPQNEEKPASQVDTSPVPAVSAEPSATGSVSPGASPSASGGTAPVPGATAQAPGTGSGSATDTDPVGPAEARPTAAAPTSGEGGSGSSFPDTSPSAPASTAETTPDKPDDGPTAPSGPPAPGEAGISNRPVADGQQTPPPVAEEPAPRTSSRIPSPEHNL
ncbi:hypothetical protein ABZ079_22560 [Streptomyces sp. NPDC006314]|uniref:hypothetical protein n=1 Tax=Streptomyces sp. NPDC006314 TaxID=3154475 RepID=UPI0033BC28D3